MSDTIDTPDDKPPATSITLTAGPPDKRVPETFEIQIPSDFVMLEELSGRAQSASEDILDLTPIAAAITVLCCPALCRRAQRNGMTYAGHDHQPRAFGRAVYGWMHKEGVDKCDILAAFAAIYPQLHAKLWPRADEVTAALGKSKASAAP